MGELLAVPADSGDSSGPFDLVMGLPLHPLVVHAVIVLVPLTALGVLVMAAWPRFSQLHGWIVAGTSVVAAGSAFVAKEAGEALEERVGEPGYDHAELGTWMPFFALALAVVAISLWLVDRSAPDGPHPRRTLRMVVAVVAVVVALANVVWVVRVGDSGARSVWSGRVE